MGAGLTSLAQDLEELGLGQPLGAFACRSLSCRVSAGTPRLGLSAAPHQVSASALDPMTLSKVPSELSIHSSK